MLKSEEVELHELGNILKNTYPQSTREQLLNLNILWRFGSSIPNRQQALSMSDADFDVLLVKAMKPFLKVFASIRLKEKNALRYKDRLYFFSNAQKENLREGKEALRLLKQLGLESKVREVANSIPKEDPRDKPPVAPPPAPLPKKGDN